MASFCTTGSNRAPGKVISVSLDVECSSLRFTDNGNSFAENSNMSSLTDKVAIVTGASKAIGSGIASALAAAGARVVVNYSSDRAGAERVAQAIADSGGQAIPIGADVSNAAEVAQLFHQVD